MKKIVTLIILIIVLIALAVFFYPRQTAAPVDNGANNEGRVMSVENYVKLNISELSPIKETVGGKFFVTDITVRDGEGTVSYEDGHNAYTADFKFDTTDIGAIQITSFDIRD